MGLISPICLRPAFTCADPRSAKRQSRRQCLFELLGSLNAKPACKILVKLTPVHNLLSNHFSELLKVNFSISVEISCGDHLIDFLARNLDRQIAHDKLQLFHTNHALAVTIESERIFKLFVIGFEYFTNMLPFLAMYSFFVCSHPIDSVVNQRKIETEEYVFE